MEKKEVNKEELRRLIRNGIGTRSVAETAKQAGITREYMSRILNGAFTSTPSEKVLEKIASAMPNISLNDLRAACGYDLINIDEKAARVKGKIEKGLREFFKNGAFRISSVEDLLDTINLLYMDQDGEFSISSNNSIDNTQGDRRAVCRFRWKITGFACTTYFSIDYAPAGDYIFCLSYEFMNDMGKGEFWHPESATAAIDRVMGTSDSRSMEERLLAAIFGEGEHYTVTYQGFGFYYDGNTPDGFREYLCAHASDYCTSPECSKRFRQTVDGADPDKVFADFGDDDYGWDGTGNVIAKILSKETGLPFGYWGVDNDADNPDACIMLDSGSYPDGRNEMPSSVIMPVYEAAKALGIKKFGTVYHSVSEIKSCKYDFDTENFYMTFRN